MSTPHSSSRKTVRGRQASIHSPHTPVGDRPMSFQPQSEYLRSALRDRQARDITPVPVKPPAPRARSISPAPSSDPWVDNVESEEIETPPSSAPRRARRTSEVGASRPIVRRPTQREKDHQKQMERNHFDLGLKLQLLEDQNMKLMKELQDAKKRIEELEDLQERNEELQEQNDRLTLDLQNMEEDLTAQEEANAEFIDINDAMIEELEKKDAAIVEAADMIHLLEQEKNELKEQLANRPTGTGSDYYSTEAEDSPRRRAKKQLHVLESRPSTAGQSNSDYYSQPNSPAPPSTQESPPKTPVGPYSERARTLVRTTSLGRNSTQDLRKRLSQVSNERPKSRLYKIDSDPQDIPPVPKLPANVPSISVPSQSGSPVKTTRRFEERYKPTTTFAAAELESPETSPGLPGPTPKTPVTEAPPKVSSSATQGGLRSMYRSGGSVRPPVKRTITPVDPTSVFQAPAYRPSPPPRQSSRFARTSYGSSQGSREKPTHPSAQSSQEFSGQEFSGGVGGISIKDSIGSEYSTTDADTQTTPARHQNLYWKDLERVIDRSPGVQRGSQPTTPLGGDFFFNASEGLEEFASRTKGFGPRR